MKLREMAISCLLLAATVSASCTKDAMESVYAGQEKLIETFTQSLDDALITRNGGSTRVTVSEGEGVELNARGKAVIYYAGYNFSSGQIAGTGLFATNREETAASANWELSGEKRFEPVELALTDKDLLAGLRSGLEGVREGEECYILFSSKYAFGGSRVGIVPPNTAIAFHIWVESIQN